MTWRAFARAVWAVLTDRTLVPAWVFVGLVLAVQLLRAG